MGEKHMKNMDTRKWLSRSLNFDEQIKLHQDTLAMQLCQSKRQAEMSTDMLFHSLSNNSIDAKDNIAKIYKIRIEIATAISHVKCEKTQILLTRKFLLGNTIAELRGKQTERHALRLIANGIKEIGSYLKERKFFD